MMGTGDTEQFDWKLLVRGLKERGTTDARVLVEKTIIEAAGAPIRLRDARRRLFILTTSACQGRPSIVEGAEGLICLIALDDLVEVVMEKGPTLSEVVQPRSPRK